MTSSWPNDQAPDIETCASDAIESLDSSSSSVGYATGDTIASLDATETLMSQLSAEPSPDKQRDLVESAMGVSGRTDLTTAAKCFIQECDELQTTLPKLRRLAVRISHLDYS